MPSPLVIYLAVATLVVLLPSKVSAEAVEGAETLGVLNDPDWTPDHCTTSQRESLLAEWRKTFDAKLVTPHDLSRLYNRLGEDSYPERQSASHELYLLGSKNSEVLQRLCETDNNPERVFRARRIIAQWQKEMDNVPIRLRNIFRVWEVATHAQQLEHVIPLITEIQHVPIAVSFQDPRPNKDPDMLSHAPRERSIRLAEEVFPKIVRKLVEHETPEANLTLMSFLRENNKALVTSTIRNIGRPSQIPDVAPDLIRLAEGKDKEIALCSLSALSNWGNTSKHRAEITAMLKRLYRNIDEDIALEAAIISCYSGDWSGFPMILETARSPDKTKAIKAIGQPGTTTFEEHEKEIIPILIPLLNTDDLSLLDSTIEAFGTYKGTAKYILPFLTHENSAITDRAIVTLRIMGAVEAIKPLHDLRSKSSKMNENTLRAIDEALSSLEKLKQTE